MKVVPLALAIAAIAGISYAVYDQAGDGQNQLIADEASSTAAATGAVTDGTVESKGAFAAQVQHLEATRSLQPAVYSSTGDSKRPAGLAIPTAGTPNEPNEPRLSDAREGVPSLNSRTASTQAGVAVTARESGSYRPATERGRLAGDVVKRWSGYVQQLYGTSAMQWADSMADTFAEADLENLRQAAGRETYEAMMGTLMGQGTSDEQAIDMIAKSGGSLSSLQVLGSAANDLVYTMVNPCRIMDSRVAGGRLTGGLARSIVTHGANFTAQGGSATNCGIPADPSAVAINVVAVAPDNSGFMTIYPSGTMRPNASSMNYEGGKILANEVIAKTTLGQATDLEIYSQYGTDVVIDIVGYFMAPVATALECLTTAEGATESIAAGGVANVFAPSCPSGYASVGVQCRPDSFNLTLGGIWVGHCNYKNNTAGTLSAAAASRCCRVPGR